MLSRFDFILKETLANLTRQSLLTLAVGTTSTLALTLLGGSLILLLLMQNLGQRLLNQLEMAVYVKRSLSRQQSYQLSQKIRSLPEVESVRLITKEEAWAQRQRDYKPLLDLSGLKNPLSDRLRVKVKNPETLPIVADRIRKFPEVDEVREARQEVTRLFKVIRFLRVASLVLSAFLLLTAFLVISNTIRITLFARRQEIWIMQMVGATDSFIRLPFLLEGVFYGIFGAFGAIGLLSFLMIALRNAVLSTMPFLFFLPNFDSFRGVCITLFLAGLILGITGSWVSLHRFLRGMQE